jgi:hypothetical protein
MEQIAVDAGFGSAVSLRQHFAATLGTSPSAYRREFRGCLEPLKNLSAASRLARTASLGFVSGSKKKLATAGFCRRKRRRPVGLEGQGFPGNFARHDAVLFCAPNECDGERFPSPQTHRLFLEPTPKAEGMKASHGQA